MNIAELGLVAEHLAVDDAHKVLFHQPLLRGRRQEDREEDGHARRGVGVQRDQVDGG